MWEEAVRRVLYTLAWIGGAALCFSIAFKLIATGAVRWGATSSLRRGAGLQ
jgi:hypothetical protein